MKIRNVINVAAAAVLCISAFALGRASAPASDLVITASSTAGLSAMPLNTASPAGSVDEASADIYALSANTMSEGTQPSGGEDKPDAAVTADTAADGGALTASGTTSSSEIYVDEPAKSPESAVSLETPNISGVADVAVPATEKAPDMTEAPETKKSAETIIVPETTRASETIKIQDTTQAPETVTIINVGTVYVLNTNTKKIHKQDCQYVKQIKPENYSTTTDCAGAIAQGYEPCKKCKP